LAVKWFLTIVLLTLTACASGDGDLRRLQDADGWQVDVFDDAQTPSVAAYRPVAGSADTLWVYIEGDGRAWLTPRIISPDPTPLEAVALHMAEVPQPHPVLYLGRPCQYPRLLARACDSRFWSLERYGAQVVRHMNKLLDVYLKKASARRLVLVGYSGGGAVAALVAAERQDVAMLATVGANLDLASWTAHHNITPLSGSIDPVTRAPELARIVQIHFVGIKDTIVPAAIFEAYMKRLPAGHAARVRSEPFDHRCCWAEAWPRLRAEIAALIP
jgi:predicted esterase